MNKCCKLAVGDKIFQVALKFFLGFLLGSYYIWRHLRSSAPFKPALQTTAFLLACWDLVVELFWFKQGHIPIGM